MTILRFFLFLLYLTYAFIYFSHSTARKQGFFVKIEIKSNLYSTLIWDIKTGELLVMTVQPDNCTKTDSAHYMH